MWVVAERGFPGGFHGRSQPEDGSIAGHSFVNFFFWFSLPSVDLFRRFA